MSAFIHEDFLLATATARRLYHGYAEGQPILDYHCHLPVADLAADRRFANLTEIWLDGDHYKWRAMRACGVEERRITGDAPAREKFLAWAAVAPRCLGNPLYHWTHLELKRYFDFGGLLGPETAAAVWERANRRLQTPERSARGILGAFGVRAVCTTDSPTDDLAAHRKLQAAGLRIFPTFRPDGALHAGDAAAFNRWTDQLAARANIEIRRLGDFLDALRARHAAFHAAGCRLSDHGLNVCLGPPCSAAEAASAFAALRGGQPLAPEAADGFASFLMMFFGHLDAKLGWTKQLHLGAMRNGNTRMRARLGPDTGFDSIGDWPQARALGQYMDRLDREEALPRMIIYNANPAENYAFAALAGNFSDERGGKVQFGSGWWFLDQKEAMEWQMNALAHTGLLSRFVGMVTDSRSFLSYPRHEYFRRVLCNLLGAAMERGELPGDDGLVGEMIADICFRNAEEFLRLPELAEEETGENGAGSAAAGEADGGVEHGKARQAGKKPAGGPGRKPLTGAGSSAGPGAAPSAAKPRGPREEKGT